MQGRFEVAGVAVFADFCDEESEIVWLYLAFADEAMLEQIASNVSAVQGESASESTVSERGSKLERLLIEEISPKGE